MKALSILLLAFVLACPSFAEKAVPFDNISFKVLVSSTSNDPGLPQSISNVYVLVDLDKGSNMPHCTIEANCIGQVSRYDPALIVLTHRIKKNEATAARIKEELEKKRPEQDKTKGGLVDAMQAELEKIRIENQSMLARGREIQANIKQQLLDGIQTDLELMQISEDGIDALKMTAEASAKDGPLARAADKEIRSNFGITTFKPLKRNGQAGVEISRNGVQVYMTVEEALMMAKDYQEAIIAKTWYEKMLTADNMPTPDDTAKPPRGTIASMIIDLGKLVTGPFRYQVLATSIGEHAIQHELDILEHNGAHRQLVGPRVREMMIKVAEANQAAQKLDGYSFIGRHGISRYEVTAQPAANTSELRIHPEFGHSRLFHHKADFDMGAAQQLASIITQADKVEKFLTDNLELLVLEEEGDGKPLE